MENRKLIFDLGLHRGLDARNYLGKGFNVVGLEAVPALCERAKAENADAIEAGRLTIVNHALFNKSGQTVEFYINPDHDDWGSLTQGAAEKGVGSAVAITVSTTTLSQMLTTYGLPYYIKCDLEGGDAIFVEQLLTQSYRPSFVSIEATSADDIAKLRAAGYTRFQIVNQWMNPFTRPPNPPREGQFYDVQFTHEMSGLFGRELNPNAWWDFTTCMRAFLDWYDLRARSADLAIGWLDVHVTTDQMLD